MNGHEHIVDTMCMVVGFGCSIVVEWFVDRDKFDFSVHLSLVLLVIASGVGGLRLCMEMYNLCSPIHCWWGLEKLLPRLATVAGVGELVFCMEILKTVPPKCHQHVTGQNQNR